MKEDLKSWSRKLHNQKPPDLYNKAKTPHKTIISSTIMTALGILQIYLGVIRTMKDESIENSCLQLAGGVLMFIPGLY